MENDNILDKLGCMIKRVLSTRRNVDILNCVLQKYLSGVNWQ